MLSLREAAPERSICNESLGKRLELEVTETTGFLARPACGCKLKVDLKWAGCLWGDVLGCSPARQSLGFGRLLCGPAETSSSKHPPEPSTLGSHKKKGHADNYTFLFHIWVCHFSRVPPFGWFQREIKRKTTILEVPNKKTNPFSQPSNATYFGDLPQTTQRAAVRLPVARDPNLGRYGS